MNAETKAREDQTDSAAVEAPEAPPETTTPRLVDLLAASAALNAQIADEHAGIPGAPRPRPARKPTRTFAVHTLSSAGKLSAKAVISNLTQDQAQAYIAAAEPGKQYKAVPILSAA